MVGGPTNLPGVGGVGNAVPAGGKAASAPTSGTSFADTLKNSIDEVSRLQQDATQAVNEAATGQDGNMTGVMTAVEKADLAFKTLLAIRSKLIDAYDEIKSMNV